MRQGYDKCVDISNAFMLYLSDHPEINKIILVSRWSIYAMGSRFKSEKGHIVYIRDDDTDSLSLDENKRVFDRSMGRTLEKRSLLGRQIFLVTQVPETEWNIPIDTARAKLLNRTIEFRPKLADYLERQVFVTEVIERYKGTYIFDLVQPHQVMCTDDYCIISNNGVPIYRDFNHLTQSYAKKLSKLFSTILVAPNFPKTVYQ